MPTPAVQHIPIGSIKPNPSNPRTIRDERFHKLVQSIKDFPEMLELRPIVTDADRVVLGGNMRLKACKAAGLKIVPVVVADHLTESQRREFIIKDNVGFGDWDWDALANEWDAGELAAWGLEVPNGEIFSESNQEINTEAFADESILKLTYTLADYEKVRAALSQIAATPEQAVWKLLAL